MAAFRVPKGVRLDGRGIGGRFIALGDLPSLAAALDAKSRGKLTRALTGSGERYAVVAIGDRLLRGLRRRPT